MVLTISRGVPTPITAVAGIAQLVADTEQAPKARGPYNKREA
jgi:hypothetical protein